MVGRVDGGLRTYRVGRISESTVLNEKFQRPEDFELAGYWEQSVAAYQASMPSFTATVRLRTDSLDRLEWRSALLRDVQSRPGWPTPTRTAGLRSSFRLEDLWHAEAQLLMLGAAVEVLEPAELRDRVGEAARNLARLYEHVGEA